MKRCDCPKFDKFETRLHTQQCEYRPIRCAGPCEEVYPAYAFNGYAVCPNCRWELALPSDTPRAVVVEAWSSMWFV